ncbi:MAG: DUF2953 domain-containing protein [Bacillota bacterium]|nr:DUF2953 domain-containing protein [Bacillota bacterium]
MILLFTPVKLEVIYENGLKRIRIYWWSLHLTVFPPKPAKKHAAKTKAKKENVREKKRELPFEITSVSDVLRFAKKSAGRTLKSVLVERFNFSLTVASDDPAKTGILFGTASAGVGMLLPLFEDLFRVKERTVNVFVDFSKDTPSLAADALIAAIPAQILLIGILLIFHLPVKWKKRNKDKAVSVS